MTTFLYPTRAGDTANLNQDLVIKLVLGQGASLLLLYVSNVSFLDHLSGPARLDLLEAELDDLGEFLLAMAAERIENTGVSVDTVICHGSFRDALTEVVRAHNISTVILGYPSQETALTTHDYIDALAEFLVSELSVEVYVIDQGDIIKHYDAPPQEER